MPIAIEVRHRNGSRANADGDTLTGGKGTIASANQNRDIIGGLVSGDEVGMPIVVEVRHRNGEGTSF